MACLQYALFILIAVIVLYHPARGKSTDETTAAEFLKKYEQESPAFWYNEVLASWVFNTNISSENEQKSIEASMESSQFRKNTYTNASEWDWEKFQDPNLKRAFSIITKIGESALEDQDYVEYKEAVSEMESIYSTAKACKADGTTCLPLEPDLVNIMANSNDTDELLWAWKAWRDASGKKMRKNFEDYVRLSNKAAVMNGYRDTGEDWRGTYEVEGFEKVTADLFDELKPLYSELHAYVRMKLREKYGKDKFPDTGHIPAHILGNMWAQGWRNIAKLVTPYPEKQNIDVTQKMIEKGYDATKMFQLSEEFFTSLGLIAMPASFWTDSMLVKPSDGRNVVCHASAWDFYNGKDFRIKQCTKVTQEQLITVHHEMGHIQYYLQYKDQPLYYKGGANPGFHEAVGDVMALSVQTAEHLKKIGLLDTVETDKEADINFLMDMALQRIAFIPFGYLIDKWRWDVFAGKTPPSKYNTDWWNYRCDLQGISPPVGRSENDFDPGAKFHIPGNTPYIRYFISYVLQFQMHKSLCKEAGQAGPLHRCDIYQSKAAGTKMSDMLSMGASKPWPEALEKVTGTKDMSVAPLLEYFQPLRTWLQERLKEAGEETGWKTTCPQASGTQRVSPATFWIFVFAIVYYFL